MEISVWWVLSAALVILELLSGTFYLLMLALGTLIAALAQLFGADTNAQMTLAAVIGLGSASACYYYRKRQPKGPVPSADPGVAQDVGAWIEVDTWLTGGRARVQYRGTSWEAQAESAYRKQPGAPDPVLQPGRYRVSQVVGICLILQT